MEKIIMKNAAIKKKRHIDIFEIFLCTFILLLGLITIYPVLHTLYASLSDPYFARTYNGLFFYPHGFTLEGYKTIFKNDMLIRSFFNSAIYTVSGVALNMLLTTIGAFVLSRRDLVLNKAFMFIIVFTMFFGGGLLPFYRLVSDLGMKDTLMAMIVPVAISPWNMIVLRTAFMSVPDEIYESARIDGASNIRVMIFISVPLVKATIAIITLYYTVGHWNSWFNAMLFLRDRQLYPLQLVLREILILNDTSQIDAGSIMQSEASLNLKTVIKYCTTFVAMLPMLVIFPFVQKNFTKGIFIGSLKA